MSEDYFKSESYLRGANNDLMDPNWRPSFTKEVTPLSLVQDLVSSFLSIKQCFKKSFNEDPDIIKNSHNYNIKVSMSYEQYLNVQTAIKNYEELNKPKTDEGNG